MEQDLTKYTYDAQDTVEIPAKMFEYLMTFLNELQKAETYQGFCDMFGIEAPEIEYKDFEGTQKMKVVKEKLMPYDSVESYYNQETKVFRSALGLDALRMVMDLTAIHEKNIQSGKAKIAKGVFTSGEA